MISVNLRFTKFKAVAAVALCAAVICTVVILKTAEKESPASVLCQDSSTVAEYICSFGLEINTDECVTDEITVPSVFTDVYEDYNKIQLSQGFDLERYRGCVLTRYTYPVNNYPDNTLTVFAEVMTYDGLIVAADIYSADLEGFISALK